MEINEILPIEEGVYDPHIFKAILMAGGPGSGKTYVANQIVGGSGLRMVNSDDFFVYLARKYGHDINDIMGTKTGDELHRDAGVKAKRKQDTMIDGRIGLLIDGTGRNYNKIATIKKYLEDYGYETKMLFVNTDLETALKRNQLRSKTVHEPLVKAAHKSITNNLGKFQSLFGPKDMIIVDNSENSVTDLPALWKSMKKWLDTDVNTPAARRWKQEQLANKKSR